MALKLFYTDDRGVSHVGSYWRIGRIVIDTDNDHCDMAMLGYANAEAAKKPRKQPVGAMSVTISNKDYQNALAMEEAKIMCIREIVYGIVKADKFFAGAESV